MAAAPHVIVTGGAGFIGSHFVERLLADGRRVTVIDDFSTGQRENLKDVGDASRLVIVTSRVSEVGDLAGLIRGAHSIVHLAATVGVELVLEKTSAAIANNFREAEAILTAAAHERVPIFVASSSEVYGRSDEETLDEEHELILGPPAVGRWSYGCSKLMIEFFALALARERGLPVVVGRLFNTVGPRQIGRHGMVLPRLVEAARAGTSLRVYGDGRQTRCFCWVEDAVEAIVRLLEAPAARGAVVNIGNDQPIAIGELAELVRTCCASQSPIELVPYEKAYGPGFEDLERRRPRLARLEALTGFKPSTSLMEIVRRMAGGGGVGG